MLDRLQRGLEALYRIDTNVRVDDFLIDEASRQQLNTARSPREQLLVHQQNDELSIGLFVDRRSIDNLERNDPSHVLGEHNLADFLLAIEGVSHFVYVAWAASETRSVSALELELQAEVDKYVTCILTADGDRAAATRLHQRLFREFVYEPDLDDDERERYRVANENAARYSASLRRRFVATRRIAEMLPELRRFYRLPLRGKIELIRRAA